MKAIVTVKVPVKEVKEMKSIIILEETVIVVNHTMEAMKTVMVVKVVVKVFTVTIVKSLKGLLTI